MGNFDFIKLTNGSWFFSAHTFLVRTRETFLLCFDRLLHNLRAARANWGKSIKYTYLLIAYQFGNFRSSYTRINLWYFYHLSNAIHGAILIRDSIGLDSIKENKTNFVFDKIISQTCNVSHFDVDLDSEVFVRNVKWSRKAMCDRRINFDRRNRRKSKRKKEKKRSPSR